MSDEYPRKMRWLDGEVDLVVEVFGPPSAEGFVPIRWPSGDYDIERLRHISPLPSPDDIVEVTVKMTRAQRDYIAGTTPAVSVADNWSPVVDACRAHRDAEA